MARQFPRFLFSDPQNVKNKGPFIIHTLEPRFIVRVSAAPLYNEKLKTVTNGVYNFTFLDEIEYSEKVRKITDDMFDWFHAQQVGFK